MFSRTRVCLLLASLVVMGLGIWPRAAAAQEANVHLDSLPLAFERNEGQAPSRYAYLTKRGGMQTYFAADGIDLLVAKDRKTATAVRLTWVGATSEARLEGSRELPGRSNYLVGADETKWVRNAPQYEAVRYAELYPGIDLEFHGYGETLEHDFIVRPGADASRIALQLSRGSHLSKAGELVVELEGGTLRFLKPVAYQTGGTSKTQVDANFVQGKDGRIGFRIGKYDHTRELVIDPVFVYSTYLNGSSLDEVVDVTTDAAGNVYVTGDTQSPDFPVTNSGDPLCTNCAPVQYQSQGFVSKLGPQGKTLLFSTILGGSISNYSNSGTTPNAIRLDSNGNIYVAGTTQAADFPHAGGVTSPAVPGSGPYYFFVSSLRADGSAFNYSGRVGGRGDYSPGWNQGKLAVDASGNAYLTDVTDDPAFQLSSGVYNSTPPTQGYSTLFALKLNATGQLVYSTLVPGTLTPRPNGSTNPDLFVPEGIVVDGSGQVTISGTAGGGLPVTPGVLQPTHPYYADDNPEATAGFALQLNAAANALNFSTYLPATLQGKGLARESHGNFYIVGATDDASFPVGANAYQKTNNPSCACHTGYILELDAQGKSLLAATYLGGPSGSAMQNVSVNSTGSVVVAGTIWQGDFPLKNPIMPAFSENGILSNSAVAALSANLSTLQFGTYVGSQAFSDGGGEVLGLAVDTTDKVVVVGRTYATDFPTTSGSYQPLPPANPVGYPSHGFVSKLDLATPAPAVCLPQTQLNLGIKQVGVVATGSIPLTNCGNATLRITSVASDNPVFTGGGACASVAPGTTCNFEVNFTPADNSTVTGTLTLTTNAPISTWPVQVSGQGGQPNVVYPDTYAANDLLSGTTGDTFYTIFNTGDADYYIYSMEATGEFSVSNNCASPLPASGYCSLTIHFAPMQIGLRTGTLTITDNLPGSPHVIALTGNSLSSYATPSILGTVAAPEDGSPSYVKVTGTNYFPASQLLVNGTPRKTIYVSSAMLWAELTADDVAQISELTLSVVTPAPGGGTSNTGLAPVYAAIRNVNFLYSAYDPISGHLFASVDATSPNYPGLVVVMDPTTGTVLSSWNVGNNPAQLAVSDDGQFLYVSVTGDSKVAQVALPGGTVNFSAALGNDPVTNAPMNAVGLAVLPGHPHSWVASLCLPPAYYPCGNGIAVFDDATRRTNAVINRQVQPVMLTFLGSDATTLYGLTSLTSPAVLSKFSINATGVSLTQSSQPPFASGYLIDLLQTNGSLLYVNDGSILDPSTLAMTANKFTPVPLTPGMGVDAAASRIFFAGQGGYGIYPGAQSSVQAFDLTTHGRTGVFGIEETPVWLPIYRWGTNGLSIGIYNGMVFLRSSISSGTPPASQFYVTGVSPEVVQAGGPDAAITIAGAGFANGVTVQANGTALTTSGLTASQVQASVPAALVATPGVVQLTVKDSNNHLAYLQLVISPGPSNVTVAPTVVNFSSQNVGTTSDGQTITLTNHGSAALIVSSVTTSGDFAQTNTCVSVAPSENCTITVSFTPTAAGARTGTLQIVDNDPAGPQTVTLSGNGSDLQIGGSGTGGTSQTVAKGNPATYGLTLSPQGGFTGSVTFSCTNVPQYAACSFSPTSGTIGSSAMNVIVTITTQVQQQSTALEPRGMGKVAFAGLLAGLLLLPLGFGRQRAALRRRLMCGVLLVTLALLPMAGCGGGGSPTPPPPTTLYTPAGTYTVTFTVTSGTFTRSTPLTLTVGN